MFPVNPEPNKQAVQLSKPLHTVPCKISIWLRYSPDHKQLPRNIRRENQATACDLQCRQLVVKTIVVRKSAGQKCPCGFESHLGYRVCARAVEGCGPQNRNSWVRIPSYSQRSCGRVVKTNGLHNHPTAGSNPATCSKKTLTRLL